MASSVKQKRIHFKDPREAQSKPPYPEQVQEFPGLEEPMTPKPDHGEESYKGSGKLEGRKAPSATVKNFRDAVKKLGGGS